MADGGRREAAAPTSILSPASGPHPAVPRAQPFSTVGSHSEIAGTKVRISSTTISAPT
jgi:hypothetical protein